MTARRILRAAAAALICAAPGLPAGAAARPPPAADISAFDSQVGAAKAAMMGAPQEALARAQGALTLARGQDGDPRRAVKIATAQWLEGEALLRLNRLAEARPIVDAALASVAVSAPNSKLHGDLMMAQGGVLATTGQVQPALRDFQTAYTIFGAAHEPRSQAMALQNIGSIYQDAGDYPKVLQYYAQSAELYRGDPALLVSAYHNTANALKEQKKYPEAEAEFQRARAVAREMKSPFLEGMILADMAQAEVLAGHLDAADRHIAEGQRLSQGDPAAREWRPFLTGVAAQAALKRGQLSAAAALIEKTFADANPNTTSLLYRDFHETAFQVYSKLGDDRRALTHLQAFKRLDDEARELSASTNAALMSARFDFANQASRIAQLKAGQLQRDIALARSRNLFTLVLLAGSMLVAGLLFVSFLYIRRSRNEVRLANAQLGVVNISLERALKARTEFLATTSHEIRTPLNGILGMTQVILAQRALDPGLREKIGLVQRSGETLVALVDDILDVAKIETGKLVIDRTDMDLAKLIDETALLWTERAHGKGLALTLDVADAPTRIVEDGVRLRQVLFNLLSNAIKFTDRGEVRLSARVEVDELGERLAIRISDTGIGIPPDRLGEVFESFSQVDGSITRAYGGTGLGLSICRSLTQAMGGDISVESVLAEGSTFTVRLPLERSQLAQAAAPAAAAAAADQFADCSILLVDANPLSQSILRAVLQPKVRAFAVVGSLAEALPALDGAACDLVLADLVALELDGEDRARAVRALADAAHPAPLTVMAAAPTDQEAALLLASGAAQVIRKPIAAQALAAELRAGFELRLAPAEPSGRGSMFA